RRKRPASAMTTKRTLGDDAARQPCPHRGCFAARQVAAPANAGTGSDMMTRSKIGAMAVGALLTALSLPAMAQEPVLGAPHDKGLGLQAPATALAEELDFVHNAILLPIITVITLFVMALLLIVIFRFNEKRNPVPSKTTHNTLLEVVWTVVPALILVFIAVFSFPLLYRQLEIPNPELTVRAIGHQWY